MQTRQKLLVPVDGSERSFKTIEYISSVRPFLDQKVVLYHVFTGIPEGFLDLEKEPAGICETNELGTWEAHKRKDIEAFMEQAKKHLMDADFQDNAVEIKIHNREKGVARDILAEAAKGYLAVALYRRGTGKLQEIAIGSIAGKLISKLTFLPVIISAQTQQREKILVGIDGSDHSIRAAEFAGEIFGGYGYRIELLHVIRGLGGPVPAGAEFMMPAECLEGLAFEMKKLFMALKEKLLKSGFEEDQISEKIITGACSRAETIVEEAQGQECQTIVVGRKGLSSVQEFFMGRVSDRIIQTGKEFTVWIV